MLCLPHVCVGVVHTLYTKGEPRGRTLSHLSFRPSSTPTRRTLGQFLQVIRRRLALAPEIALILFVSDHSFKKTTLSVRLNRPDLPHNEGAQQHFATLAHPTYSHFTRFSAHPPLQRWLSWQPRSLAVTRWVLRLYHHPAETASKNVHAITTRLTSPRLVLFQFIYLVYSSEACFGG